MTHRRRLRALVATLLTATGALAPAPATAGVQVTGAGSTFAQIAIDEWRAGAARKLGLDINYSGQGSSAGRNAFIEGTVDFASSDIPFEPNERPPRAYVYLPLVAGGTALMYNLVGTDGKRITDLQFSGRTIAMIFTAQVRNWAHPAVLADNPHLAGRLPDQEIKTVTRSGGSGTTAVFTGYMAKVAPDVWADFARRWDIRGEFTSNFPPVPAFIAQSGSDGVANFVSNPNAGRGSLGYAEAGYAEQRGLPMAYVKNQAGRYTHPTARNVAIALTQAQRNPDGTQNLNRVYFNDNPESYAISSYNYMIAPTTGFDSAKGDVLGRYVIYAITEGQEKADALGYSPLPPNLVQQGLDAVTQIPGAPAPPPLGDWGRYYERLRVGQPAPGESANSTRPGTPEGGGQQGGAAGSQRGVGSPAAAGGAPGGAAGQPGATPRAAAGRAAPGAPGAGAVAAGGRAGGPGGLLPGAAAGGAAIPGAVLPGGGGQLVPGVADAAAMAAINTAPRSLAAGDVAVKTSSSTPLLAAGVALVLLIVAPPLLASVPRPRPWRRRGPA